MNGLYLSERYYETFGRPMLEKEYPAYADRIACGLCGEGSECLGFDDMLSRDHDWGVGFCLWLTDEDYAAIGPQLHASYASLPESFLGTARKQESATARGRTGVLRISDYYRKFTGAPEGPCSTAQWQRIPEHFLAAAVSGKVFSDPLGRFSAIRQKLLDFYPEDIRIKKLSYQCHCMGQAGQYNYLRLCQRGDASGAFLALSQFTQAAMKAVYLLNRRYAPYYKWLHRGMETLCLLPETGPLIEQISADSCMSGEQPRRIEAICRLVRQEMTAQQLTSCGSDFLCDQSFTLLERISDPSLAGLPVSVDCC